MNAKQRNSQKQKHKRWCRQVMALLDDIAASIEAGELSP